MTLVLESRFSGTARRRAGAVAFSPTDLADLAAWYRFNQGITGEAVSQWDDASGNARHLLQATGAAQPAKQGDGSILFDGTSDFLKTDAFTLNQPCSVVLFGKQLSWASGLSIFQGFAAGSIDLSQRIGTPSVAQSGDNNNVLISSWALGTNAMVVAGYYNSASNFLSLNGGVPVSADPVLPTNPGGFTLGAHSAGINFSNIQVKEVVITAGALTAAEIAKLYAYGQANGLVA